MGFSTYYQAIPENSRLLERLKGERAFCRFYTYLIPEVFRIQELNAEDLEEILNDIAENEFAGSRDEAGQCLNDLTAELAAAVAKSPGLQDRAAYIEYFHDEIEGVITQELSRRESGVDPKLMGELLYGGDALAPEFFDQSDSQLRFISASVVTKGAKLLAEIELPQELHGIADSSCEEYDSTCEQYQGWKELFLQAARCGEAVLVLGTS